ncbi:Ig-like domain-containing protein, partial [Marinomonas sp. C2222]
TVTIEEGVTNTIEVEVNGQTYTATVDENGSWSVEVDGEDVIAAIESGTDITVTVTSTDEAGNTATETTTIDVSDINVDVSATAGEIAVDAITLDDVINAAESSDTIAVSGTATGGDIAEGDVVSMTINGTTYTTTVDADGNWTVDVDGADLAADTEFEVSVASEDAAGNTVDSTATSTHTVDSSADAGTVTVSDITSDDVINAAESSDTIAVSGTATGGDIAEGDVVSMTINGTTYTTTVDADGNWTVDVDGADLAADTEFEVSVASEDAVGNTVDSTATSTHTVDSSADAGTVTVSDITSDDVINAAESSDTIAVSGTATGGDIAEGDVVSMTINGTTYTTTVDADGNWTVDVDGADLAADTEFEVSVASEDAVGNTVDSTATSTHTVDSSADAGTVTVSDITSDDVINAAESSDTIAVSGTATGGDIAEGDVVSMTINGTTYTTTVDADGNWTVDVDGADLAADTEFEVSVASEDAAGNTVDSTATSTHTVDTSIATPSISFESTGDDSVYNAEEVGEDGAVTATISVTGSEVGDTLAYIVDGGFNSVTLTQDDIDNGVEVEVVPGESLKALTADSSGNISSAVTETAAEADLTAESGTVTVDAITEDDVISASEAASTVTVTGTAMGGDIADGDLVTLEINGETYTTTVDENGEWSVDVQGSDLAAETAFDAVVMSSDEAGNTVNTTGSSTHTVDIVAESGTVKINVITSDDVINANESGGNVTIFGRAYGGDIAEGDTITLEINGTTYTSEVKSSGNWNLSVSGVDLAADTEFDVTITSTDDVGNTVTSIITSTHTVDLDIATPEITFESTGDDSIYNAEEIGEDETVTATISVSGSEVGDTLTYTVEGSDEITVTLSQDDIDNGIGLEVSPRDTLVATLSDDAGNSSDEVSETAPEADLTADSGTVTVNAITVDDIVNATEASSTIEVSGTAIDGDIVEGDIVTLVINGTTYTTTVDGSGEWVVDIDGADLEEDAYFDAVVTSTDDAGNTVESTGSSFHTIDTSAVGGIDVDGITSDSIIGPEESAEGVYVTLTGYVFNDATAGDTIIVYVDGNAVGTATVSNETNDDGQYTYTVDVLGSDLVASTSTPPQVIVTVTGTDDAGNEFSASTSEAYQINTNTNADIDLFVFDDSGDNIINSDEVDNVTVGAFYLGSTQSFLITITDSEGGTISTSDAVIDEDYGDSYYIETYLDVSSLADGSLSVTVSFTDADGVVSSKTDSITKDTGTVVTEGTASDDVIEGKDYESSDESDTLYGYSGSDELTGGEGGDILIGGAGNDILTGGFDEQDDGSIDTMTGGDGEDTFVLQGSDTLDIITDFSAKDDKLDLTALLSDLDGSPSDDADAAVIEAFLTNVITVTDKSVEINGAEVAVFGENSDFDSNQDGTVDSYDTVNVIYNDQEFSIYIDG